MASSPDIWKNQIRDKLITILSTRAEDLVRVLWYLDQEDHAYSNDITAIAPTWHTLRALLNMQEAFERFAENLSEDTRRAGRDPDFRKTMNLVYSEMMKPSNNRLDDHESDHKDLVRFGTATGVAGFMGLAEAWGRIPIANQAQILEILPQVMPNQLVESINKVANLTNKMGGTVVMVALAVVQLSWQAIKSIKAWLNDEITGKRCCKDIIDSLSSLTAGAAGGMAGATLGGLVGPWGALAGAVVGGLISSTIAKELSDRLTRYFFDIPKEVALENSYKYFALSMHATNNEINSAYRAKCLEHHPDKGGRTEEFHFVQVNMAIIKSHRGEL